MVELLKVAVAFSHDYSRRRLPKITRVNPRCTSIGRHGKRAPGFYRPAPADEERLGRTALPAATSLVARCVCGTDVYRGGVVGPAPPSTISGGGADTLPPTTKAQRSRSTATRAHRIDTNSLEEGNKEAGR